MLAPDVVVDDDDKNVQQAKESITTQITNNEQVVKDTTTTTSSNNVLNSKHKRGGRSNKTRVQRHKEKLPRPDYQPIVKNNDTMIKYYKQQSFLLPGEFDKFLEGLRETLPASFRINTFDIGQANFLRRLVEGPELAQFLTSPVAQSSEDNNGSEISTPCKFISEEQSRPPALEPLCWYPKRLAWQMNTTRLDLKRTPILQQFHKFLMAETDNGFISRQEAVSMIPPLLLDVHRGQDILDMCAAPGSKTAQLLEYLKHDIFDRNDSHDDKIVKSGDPFDDGMVVANDVDNKRCYMLVHQSSRLNSPNCIIINGDATRLPNMQTFNNDEEQYVDLKFDRILCDVPCSGDGTVRKNPDVWKKWTVGNANNFHGMQCKILRRGVELLKENGLLVYSTCSMNPVEDEAVIASILRASNGKVILEDVAHKLPGLKYRPGVSKWVVMNREAEVVPSADKVPPENSSQIYPSLFPPNEDEAKTFCLNKAIRILPHLQNTGGFFVAVLKKLSPNLPWDKPASKVQSTSRDQSKESEGDKVKPVPQPNPKKRRLTGFKEDPFIFMDIADPDWIAIKDAYGLSEKFPSTQLIHRCTSGKKRSIYLVSKKTRSFIMANREEPDRSEFVKIINGGMRLFSRADTTAGFRICQDGVNEVLPYIKDDIKVPINRDDLVSLLKSRAVSWDLLSNGEHIRDNIKQGSFILIYKHEEDETTKGVESFEIPLVAWKGEWTVALYVANTYRIHLCALAQLKIGDDGVIKQETTTTAVKVADETDTTTTTITEETTQSTGQ